MILGGPSGDSRARAMTGPMRYESFLFLAASSQSESVTRRFLKPFPKKNQKNQKKNSDTSKGKSSL
jgi:hypothetical protein